MNTVALIYMPLFGLAVGSFLNLNIDRVPRGMSIISPPSQCDVCARRLGLLHLVPILSYLWLRGKCRYCGARISLRSPVVELLTAALFTTVALTFDLSSMAWVTLGFSCLFITVAFIDLEHTIIPDKLVFPAILLAAATAPFGFVAEDRGTFESLWRMAAGGAVGLGIMLFIYMVSMTVYGEKPRFLRLLEGQFPDFRHLKRPDKGTLVESAEDAAHLGVDAELEAEGFIDSWITQPEGESSDPVEAWKRWMLEARSVAEEKLATSGAGDGNDEAQLQPMEVEVDPPFGFGDVKLGLLIGMVCGFPEVIVAVYIAFVSGGIIASLLVLLRLRRPRMTPTPAPPSEIAEWLLPGWDEIHGNVAVRESRDEENDGQTEVVRFEDSVERSLALENWRPLRDEWARNEAPAREDLKLSERLQRGLKGSVPYGPFLSAGAIATLLIANDIGWYANLFR